jgi:CubicO group peptidase (beta-lactamase class C family)
VAPRPRLREAAAAGLGRSSHLPYDKLSRNRSVYGFAETVTRADAAAAKTPLPAGTWSWSGAYGNSWFLDPVNGYSVVAFTNTAPEGDSVRLPCKSELRSMDLRSRLRYRTSW